MAELKGSKYYTVVTDIGQAKIANSIYSGKKLDLTLLKLGDGNGAFYNPDSSQTDVKKEVWRGNVVDVEIDADNPNWINIYTVIAPTDGGFTIREMAVFDSDGDMIGICNCAESYKPTLDEGSGKEITMKMTLAVVNTSAITLKIDPTIIYAKRKEVLTLTTKVNDITVQLNNKIELYIDEILPNVEERKKNTIYFKVTDTINTSTDGPIKASPTMGLKEV